MQHILHTPIPIGRILRRWLTTAFVLCAPFAACSTGAQAQPVTETILHPFGDGAVTNDGASPYGSLIQGSDGNFYGTTAAGGTGAGTVFEITAVDHSITILHTFGSGHDGGEPSGTLLQARDGNFYGMTYDGGTAGHGTVFEIALAGGVPTETILHSFGDGSVTNDGQYPYEGGLIQATDGNFYGMTLGGGSEGDGTVFELTVTNGVGTETILHSFGDGSITNDGINPDGSLLQASDGNFYGMTEAGGAAAHGTIFELNPSQQPPVTILHSFGDGSVTNDGETPYGNLIQVANGDFYGMTWGGGVALDGTVFQMTLASGVATLHIRHSFLDGSVTDDGAWPRGSLIQGTDGNFYGMTSGGGAGNGTAFRMTPAGSEIVLHSFADGSVTNDGINPVHNDLIEGTDGNLYGMTTNGGANNSDGTVFELATGLATHFSVSAPASVTAGSTISYTVTALDGNGDTATGYAGTVNFTSSDTAAVLPSSSTLTNGVGTFSATLKTAGAQSITATDTVSSSLIGTSGTITVNSAQPTLLVVTGPATTTAGVAFTNLQVWAKDQYGNIATGYTGTVHFTGTDTLAVLPTDAVLTNGYGEFAATLETAGSQTISATDTTNVALSAASQTITVTPNTATHFTVVAPASAPAEVAFNITITALDKYGNQATGYTGTVGFTSTDPAATLPANATLTNGIATLPATLKTPGLQTITATDSVTASITGTTANVAVNLNVATHFTVSAPATVTAGSPFQVTVTALDLYGNTVTGYSGTVHFTSTDPAATLPANATLTNGVGTFNATLDTAPTQRVTATDTATASIAGTSAGITVDLPALPAAPTGLIATALSTSQINLTWNASLAATSYSVYRGTSTTPIATVTTTAYNDTGLAAGTSYSYTVTAVNLGGPSAGAEASAGTDLNDFVGGANNAGLQMITVPINGGAPGDLFSDAGINLFSYSSTGYGNPATVKLGEGYWVNLIDTTTNLLYSTSVNTQASTTVSLTSGWNLIGDPYATAATASQISVSDNSGNAGTLGQANQLGVISLLAYTWQVGDLAYEKIDLGTAGLAPYEGYWVYAFQACTLTIK